MNNVNNMYYENYYNVNDATDIEEDKLIQKNLTSVQEGFKRGNIFTNIYWPYKKQTYNFVPKNERQKLLLEIMKNGFYAHELNLYLDNFPNDKERINLYNQYDKKTSDLIKEYNNKFEPLTLTGNELKEVPWLGKIVHGHGKECKICGLMKRNCNFLSILKRKI